MKKLAYAFTLILTLFFTLGSSMADSFITGTTFTARDGQHLSYFMRGDNSDHLIIILHGSTCHGGYYESLAHEFAAEATVCVPTIRGHHNSGDVRGSCSYIGQLEDDIVDLIDHIGGSYKKITLLGHSSGGGLALRFAQSRYSDKIHNYILLAPAIPSTPVTEKENPNVRKIGISKWKVIALALLNKIGITWFNTAKIAHFDIAQERRDGTQTDVYDFNLLVSLHPPMPFVFDADKVGGALTVLAGDEDERLNTAAYYDLFPRSYVTILPGIDHKSIGRDSRAIAEIRKHL